MKTYRLSGSDYRAMREKIRAAQTLLNVHLVAELEGRRPPSAVVRLEMAEEAEELVHDVADLLDCLGAVEGGKSCQSRQCRGNKTDKTARGEVVESCCVPSYRHNMTGLASRGRRKSWEARRATISTAAGGRRQTENRAQEQGKTGREHAICCGNGVCRGKIRPGTRSSIFGIAISVASGYGGFRGIRIRD